MSFLQAQIPFPKTAADYKKLVFSFDVEHIDPINQIELHKQTREVMYPTLTNTAMTTSKLQASLKNI